MRPHGRFAVVDPTNPEAFAQWTTAYLATVQRFKGTGVVLRRKLDDGEQRLVVYVAINKLNGKFYIGSTKHAFNQRKQGHIKASTKDLGCPIFYKALRRYGEDSFSWFIIGRASTTEALRELETKFLEELHPDYNVAKVGWGGNGGMFSEEGLRRISEFQTGNKWRLGIKVSEATRKKLQEIGRSSESRARWDKYVRLGSTAMKKAVLDLETNKIFSCRTVAATSTGHTPAEVWKHIQGKRVVQRFRFLTKEECVQAGIPYNDSHNWDAHRKAEFKVQGKLWKCRPVVSLRGARCYPSVTAARAALRNPARRGGRDKKRRVGPAGTFLICGQLFTYLKKA